MGIFFGFQKKIREIFATPSAANCIFQVNLTAMKASCSNAQATPDLLLLELANCEGRLHAWICSSAVNAEMFAKDPVIAIRAANLGLPETVLCDLENVIDSIVKKINQA